MRQASPSAVVRAAATAVLLIAAAPNAAQAAHRHRPLIRPVSIATLPCDERFQGICEAALRGARATTAVAWAAAPSASITATVSDPRPRAWCGWYMRHLVGTDPGRDFNLARNWAHWGRPAQPAVGVVVVWSHHVGLIVGRDPNGNWIVRSGNDGHTVRERAMSTAGAIAFRQG